MKGRKKFIGIAIITFCVSLTCCLGTLFKKTDATTTYYVEKFGIVNNISFCDKDSNVISNVTGVSSFGSEYNQTEKKYTVSLDLTRKEEDGGILELSFDYTMTYADDKLSLNFTGLDDFRLAKDNGNSQGVIFVYPILNRLEGYKTIWGQDYYYAHVEDASLWHAGLAGKVLDWSILKVLTINSDYTKTEEESLEGGLYSISFIFMLRDKDGYAKQIELLTDGSNPHDLIITRDELGRRIHYATIVNHNSADPENQSYEDDLRAANMFTVSNGSLITSYEEGFLEANFNLADDLKGMTLEVNSCIYKGFEREFDITIGKKYLFMDTKGTVSYNFYFDNVNDNGVANRSISPYVINYSVKDKATGEYVFKNTREYRLHDLEPGRYILEALFVSNMGDLGSNFDGAKLGGNFDRVEFEILPKVNYFADDRFETSEYRFVEYNNKGVDWLNVKTSEISCFEERNVELKTNLHIDIIDKTIIFYDNTTSAGKIMGGFSYTYKVNYSGGEATGMTVSYKNIKQIIDYGFNVYPVVSKLGAVAYGYQLFDFVANGTVSLNGEEYVSNISFGEGLSDGAYVLSFVVTCKANKINESGVVDGKVNTVIELVSDFDIGQLGIGVVTASKAFKNNNKDDETTTVYFTQSNTDIDNIDNIFEVTSHNEDSPFEVKVEDYEFGEFTTLDITYKFNGETKYLFNSVFSDEAELDYFSDGKNSAYYYNIYKKYADGSYDLLYSQRYESFIFELLNAGTYRLEVCFAPQYVYYIDEITGKSAYKYYPSSIDYCEFKVLEYAITDDQGNINESCDLFVTEMDSRSFIPNVDPDFMRGADENSALIVPDENLSERTTYLYEYIQFYNYYNDGTHTQEECEELYKDLYERYSNVLNLYNEALKIYKELMNIYSDIQEYYEYSIGYRNGRRKSYGTYTCASIIVPAYYNTNNNNPVYKVKSLFKYEFDETYVGAAYNAYVDYITAYNDYITYTNDTYGIKIINRNDTITTYNSFITWINNVRSSEKIEMKVGDVTRPCKPVLPAAPILPDVNFDNNYTGIERMPRIALSRDLMYEYIHDVKDSYYRSEYRATLYNRGVLQSSYYNTGSSYHGERDYKFITFDKDVIREKEWVDNHSYFAYDILTTNNKDVWSHCVDVGSYDIKLVFEGNYKGTVTGFKYNVTPVNVEVEDFATLNYSKTYNDKELDLQKCLTYYNDPKEILYTVIPHRGFVQYYEDFINIFSVMPVELTYEIYKVSEVGEELTNNKKVEYIKNIGTYIVRYSIPVNGNGLKNFTLVDNEGKVINNGYFDVVVTITPSLITLADDIGNGLYNGDVVEKVINSASGLYATSGLFATVDINSVIEIKDARIALSYNAETGYDFLDNTNNIVFAGKKYLLVVPIKLIDDVNYALNDEENFLRTFGEQTYVEFGFTIAREVLEIEYEDSITLTSIYDGVSHANAFENKVYYTGYDLESIMVSEEVNYKVNKSDIRYKKIYLEVVAVDDVIGVGEYEFNAKLDEVSKEWYVLPNNSVLTKTYVITPKDVEIDSATFIYPEEREDITFGDDFDLVGYSVKVTGVCNEDGYVELTTDDYPLGLFEIMGAKVIRKSVLSSLFNGYMYYSEEDEDRLDAGKYQVEVTLRSRSVNYNLVNEKVIINDLTVVRRLIDISWGLLDYEFNAEEQIITAQFIDVDDNVIWLSNVEDTENDDILNIIKVTKNSIETPFIYAGEYLATVELPSNLNKKYVISDDTISQAYEMAKLVLDNPQDYLSINDFEYSGSVAVPSGTLLNPEDIRVTLDDFKITTTESSLNTNAQCTVSPVETSSVTFTQYTDSFKIVPMELELSKLSFEFEEVTYDNTEKEPSYTLKVNTEYNKNILGYPVDFSSANYSNNINAGEDTGILTVEFTGNYSGTVEVPFTIKKATYDMSGITFVGDVHVEDGNQYSTTLTGTLPTGLDGVQVTVKYSDGKNESVEAFKYTAVGEYKVTAIFTGSSNYEDIQSMETSVKIKATQLTPKEDKKEDNPGTQPTEEKKDEVKIEYEKGFDNDIELVVEVVADQAEDGYIKETNIVTDITKEIKKAERVSKVYDIKLLKIDTRTGDVTPIQPSDIENGAELTVRIAIPQNALGKNFKILHIHSETDITEILLGESPAVGEYIIDGKYVVTKINKLSEFVFVVEVECPFHWILIGLLILLFAFAMVCLFTKKISNLVIYIVAGSFALVSLVLGIIGAIAYGCAGCIVFMIVNILFDGFVLYILDKDTVEYYINKVLSRINLQKGNV